MKKSSYQKLKEENERLYQAIFTLVDPRANPAKRAAIEMEYRFMMETEHMIWQGSPTPPKAGHLLGFLALLDEANPV